MARRRRTSDSGALLYPVPRPEHESRPLRVLAGLDEAGYGPLLGPLTIGCAALRSEDGPVDPWKRLAPLVGRAGERDPERLAVGDSKAVFERNARGRARLERTVLAFHALVHGAAADARAFLAATRPPLACDGLERECWHAALPARLEPGVEPGAGERTAADLARALVAARLEVVAYDVRVVPPAVLNSSFERTSSKGATHWEQCAPFLARLWEDFAAEGVDLVVDRHGGRMRYADLLAGAFPKARVDILRETPARSEYAIHAGDGRLLRATFAEKADALSFPVALASCAAKYARELAMEAFNAHFGALQPGLAPTAGYVTDARRWLAEAGLALERARLVPADLVRTR